LKIEVLRFKGKKLNRYQDEGLNRMNCDAADVVRVRLEGSHALQGVVVEDANLKTKFIKYVFYQLQLHRVI
jgi:hypothetical protein